MPADARTLLARYAEVGHADLAAPRFYAGGSTSALVVPPEFLGEGELEGCTTVTLLGAVSTVFWLHAPQIVSAKGAGEGATPEEAIASVAGVATLRRCGVARGELAEATIDMRSPRGILEVITVATKPGALLPEVRAVLRHRDPGVVPGLLRPGAPPAPAPLAARVAGFEGQFGREGAASLERRVAPASHDGDGRVFLDLAPGCHRIAVLGPEVPDTMAGFYDVDAQLAWVSGDVAASDKTESPDAALTACTGERTIGILAFAGSGDGAPVIIVHGTLALPRGLPLRWGTSPRARAARALLDRHIPGPETNPTYQSLGIAGITTLPIEVERGQCYLAVLTPVQGSAKLMSLTATSGARHSVAHANDADTAVATTWCAGGSGTAALEVEVHGNSVVWVAGLWPMGRTRLGEESP